MKFVISLSVFYLLVIINVSAQNDTIKLKEITVADSIKKETTLSMRSQSELFESCARCHTIGKGRLIGPDLAGIKEKHSEEWLIKFIQASDLVIASGDTAALRLFKENENLPMPRHDYSRMKFYH